jgi:hypothetical protein
MKYRTEISHLPKLIRLCISTLNHNQGREAKLGLPLSHPESQLGKQCTNQTNQNGEDRKSHTAKSGSSENPRKQPEHTNPWSRPRGTREPSRGTLAGRRTTHETGGVANRWQGCGGERCSERASVRVWDILWPPVHKWLMHLVFILKSPIFSFLVPKLVALYCNGCCGSICEYGSPWAYGPALLINQTWVLASFVVKDEVVWSYRTYR